MNTGRKGACDRRAVIRRVRRAAAIAFHRPSTALRNKFPALGPGPQFAASPFRTKANFHTRRLGSDNPRGLVSTRHHFHRASSNAYRISHAHKYPSQHPNAPDEQLQETRCSLVESNGERVELKFEKDTRRAAVMINLACIVRHRVLVRMQRVASRGDVRRGHDV